METFLIILISFCLFSLAFALLGFGLLLGSVGFKYLVSSSDIFLYLNDAAPAEEEEGYYN